MLLQADVITSSIGGQYGFSDDPWALTASRLVEQGVVVTIANGNDGYSGAFTESSGSNGEYVLAVASVNANVVAAASFDAVIAQGGSSTPPPSRTRPLYSGTDPHYQGWPIVAFDLDPSSDNDACSLSDEQANFNGSIVLVNQETATGLRSDRSSMAYSAWPLRLLCWSTALIIPSALSTMPPVTIRLASYRPMPVKLFSAR